MHSRGLHNPQLPKPRFRLDPFGRSEPSAKISFDIVAVDLRDQFPQFPYGAVPNSRPARPAIHVQNGLRPDLVGGLFRKAAGRPKAQAGHADEAVFEPPADRISTTQNRINEILPDKPEYVVTTSEFLDVQARLGALVRRTKDKEEDPDRPRLRRNPTGGTIPAEDSESGDVEAGEDERPTLKRR